MIVNINLGKPIIVSSVNFVLYGDALYDKDYQSLLKLSKTYIGKILNHNDYDKFKDTLTKLALSKGYFDFKFISSRLNVLPSNYEAFWDIVCDSGSRYHFGNLTFKGSLVKEEYLQNIYKIAYNSYYDSNLLSILNQYLINTRWFNSVFIIPNFSNIERKNILPIDILLTSYRCNIFETGLGYSTNIGPRIKVLWKNSLVNKYGNSIENKINISKHEQNVELYYKIPLFKNPLEEYYVFQFGFKHHYVRELDFSLINLNVLRYWDKVGDDWQKNFSLRYVMDGFNKDDNVNNIYIISPGFSMNCTSQYNYLVSTIMCGQSYSFYLSNHFWKSSFDFFVFQSNYNNVYSVNERHHLLFRSNLVFSNLSWLYGNKVGSLYSFLESFLNIDRSIRGYKNDSLLFLNTTKHIIGVYNSVSISMEYQYRLFDKWWSVLFLDEALLFRNVFFDNFKLGSGFGVRYQSPIGCLKLDIAVPVIKNRGLGVQFYIGLGPEL